MEDQILLINDMCGYGKVALAAMLPVLTHMGYRIHNLPTALVSDTLNYPKFYIQDCTEYVRNTLPIWDELGFTFDAISTGFIQSEEESRIIADFCERHAAKGTSIFVRKVAPLAAHLRDRHGIEFFSVGGGIGIGDVG